MFGAVLDRNERCELLRSVSGLQSDIMFVMAGHRRRKPKAGDDECVAFERSCGYRILLVLGFLYFGFTCLGRVCCTVVELVAIVL